MCIHSCLSVCPSGSCVLGNNKDCCFGCKIALEARPEFPIPKTVSSPFLALRLLAATWNPTARRGDEIQTVIVVKVTCTRQEAFSQANYQQVTRATNIRLLSQKVPSISGPVGLRSQSTQRSRTVHFLPAAGPDNVATETSDNDSKSDNILSNVNPSTKAESSDEVGGPNGAVKEASSPVAAKPRSSLKTLVTVRERLRAARVLSRYTESKPLKPEERGNKLLKALQDGTDKTGKQRSGLPEAPTNLLDDSKRGMPKQGWTINIIPEGMDVFLIIFSFVFISTVMFATTFLVWKLGAIHFNEY